MDALDAIATRRVVRRFADRPIEDEPLDRILDAGRRANSSKNRQRWDYIAVRDRATLRELTKVGRYADHLAGAGAAIALVTPDPRRPGADLSLVWDLGGAAAQMMLAAWALGIGSCPVTAHQEGVAQRILGYPDTHHCEYLLSLGYPADPAVLTAPLRMGGRRPLREIVHEERW